MNTRANTLDTTASTSARTPSPTPALVDCLREAERLSQTLKVSDGLGRVVAARIDALVDLLVQRGFEVLPRETPSLAEVESWLRRGRFDADDPSRVVWVGGEVRVRVDRDDSSGCVRVLERQVTRDGLESGRCRIEWVLPAAVGRAWQAMDAGDSLLAKRVLDTRTDRGIPEPVQHLSLRIQSALESGRIDLLQAASIHTAVRPASIVMRTMGTIGSLSRPSRVSERQSEADHVIEGVLAAMAPMLSGQIVVLDKSKLEELDDCDRARCIDAVGRLRYCETSTGIPAGRIHRIARVGYLLEGDAIPEVLPAVATISRGPMPPVRRLLQRVCDEIVEQVQSLADQVAVWECRADDEGVEPDAESAVVLLDVIGHVERVRNSMAQTDVHRARLQHLIDRIARDLAIHTDFRTFRPQRDHYDLKALKEDRAEFIPRYLEEGEDPASFPCGQVLETRRVGIMLRGDVKQTAEVVVSLGSKPDIVVACDRIQAMPGASGLTKHLDAVRSGMFDYRVGRRQGSSAVLGEIRDAVVCLAEHMGEIAELASIINGGDLTRQPVKAIVDYLRYEGVHILPNSADAHSPPWNGVDAVDARHWVVAGNEYSRDVAAGQILRVISVGFVSEESSVRSRPAKVVVSLGERYRLAETIHAIRSRLDAVGDRQAELREALGHLLDSGKRRNEARRLATVRSDNGSGRQLTSEDNVLADSMLRTLAVLERSMATGTIQSNVYRECWDDLWAVAVELLQVEAFPEVGTPADGDGDGWRSTDIEAITSRYSDSAPPAQVIEVAQCGIRRGDRVFRRAHVVVSRGSRPGFVSGLESLVRWQGHGDRDADQIAIEAAAALKEQEEAWAGRFEAPAAAVANGARTALALALRSKELAGPKRPDLQIDPNAERVLMADLSRRFTGFRETAAVGQQLTAAQLAMPGLCSVEFEKSEAVRGTVLRVQRQGFCHEGQGGLLPLVPAIIVVSRGQGSLVTEQLELWLRKLDGAHDGARRRLEPLAAAINEADLRGVPPRIDLEDWANVLAELDEVASRGGTVGAELPSAGPLGTLLEEAGWARYPREPQLPTIDFRDQQAFASAEGVFADGQAPGTILTVSRWGWRDRDRRVRSAAKVRYSRGPTEFVGRTLQAPELRALRRENLHVAAILERFEREGGCVDSVAAGCQLLFEIHERLPSSDARVRPLSELLLAQLRSAGAVVFPEEGDRLQVIGADACEVEGKEHSPTAPAGTVKSVLQRGLRHPQLGVLAKASIVLSLGPETDIDRQMERLGDLAAALVALKPPLPALAQQAGVLRDVANKLRYWKGEAAKRGERGGVNVDLMRDLLNACDVVNYSRPDVDDGISTWVKSLIQAAIVTLQSAGVVVMPDLTQSTWTTSALPEGIGATIEVWMSSRHRADEIIAVQQRGLRRPDGKLGQEAKVLVNRGQPSDLFTIVSQIRDHLCAELAKGGSSVAVDTLFVGTLRKIADAGAAPAIMRGVDSANELYRLYADRRISRPVFRSLRAPLADWLETRGVREFIQEGDSKARVLDNQSRVRITNIKEVEVSSKYIVEAVLQPGFEQQGVTVQPAELRIKAP